ncbi:hypothetical protein BGZ83_000597, partial [Gryganskiella cystojenkinii]
QPSQRYQNAFGFKQDILRCLNELHRTGTIESFPLGKHDVSYQFVLPNTVFGRKVEQQMISAAITQAASAYQQSIDSDLTEAGSDDEAEMEAIRIAAINNSDFYHFKDDIVSLPNKANAKISLSSKTLLRTPKPFDGVKSASRNVEIADPVVRAIFVSGPSGVGKTILIRGLGTAARNSGLFAGGIFEAEGSTPYSAILTCIQSVLQQLLTQHTDALASLVVAIRTAFEPNSGIGIICDLIPELKYFFNGSEMPESKEIPLTHSVARFHALILKLIRVISTHFFMTWLIDDLHYADENSIALLATLVNVNKRLPIVLIITHRDTIDCLMKVKQILGGCSPPGSNSSGSIHPDPMVEGISNIGGPNQSGTLNGGNGGAGAPMSKSTAVRATGLPMVVRGGGGVRFIRLQNPSMETIQEFLSALLHRDKTEVVPLAKVLYQKSWLTIRQLVLELYRNQTIHFNCHNRAWEWEPCQETLAEVVRKLTGEEYAFLLHRFRALDCDTKKILICAAICGSVFNVHDLQRLASTAYVWSGNGHDPKHHQQNPQQRQQEQQYRKQQRQEQQQQQQQHQHKHEEQPSHPDDDLEKTQRSEQEYMSPADPLEPNKGSSAMAGLQASLREGILVYTSITDTLRFHHGIMRKVSLSLLEGTPEKERLHYEMAKILSRTPGQEFRTASHILLCMDLVKRRAKFINGRDPDAPEEIPFWVPILDEDDEDSVPDLDTETVRTILSLAGEKSQKSGAQDMALSYWKAALSLLPETCWDGQAWASENFEDVQMQDSSEDVEMMASDGEQGSEEPPREQRQRAATLYHEALKLHLQCIEAERWRENFDQAVEMCDTVLSKIKDPIDRAKVFQHKIELMVWAYGQPDKATELSIQCLQELGVSKEINFSPTQEEIRAIYDETHLLLLSHMEEMQSEERKVCDDAKIIMMLEVLQIASATLYYCNVPFIAVGITQSIKLLCQHGMTKDAGRALVGFVLTHSTWHGCLENAYEVGELAIRVCQGNQHVKFLFYLTVQQWGDHIANSVPALEETLAAADMACDRLFHTAGMIHVSVMRILLGRVHLRDCMTSTQELVMKHIEFGPKSHGVEVMQGILQLVKCLKGQTQAQNPETIFDDHDYAESRMMQSKKDKPLTMVHNNSTYSMLKIVAAFIFGHYAYVAEVTSTWLDDPKSMMNFEGSWLTYSIFTVVGLALVILLRTEKDPEAKKKLQGRLFLIRDRMEKRAVKYPTNHAAMFHLLEAEIADQEDDDDDNEDEDEDLDRDQRGRSKRPRKDLKKVFLLYEKAIRYAIEGDFPLQKCFSFELAAKSHLRHGMVTSARCLLATACKGYQNWGARGKVMWFHRTYPDMFGSPPESETTPIPRGLFYRPNDAASSALPTTAATNLPDFHIHHHPRYTSGNPLAPSATVASSTLVGESSASSASGGSPWMAGSAGSPRTMYSPGSFGNDAVSAAATAIAESHMVTSLQGGGGSGGGSSASGSAIAPVYMLQQSWASSPQSPEMDNADLDILDFSSVIDAMQVIASEIDLDLLLVKSLGVLNQSVGAKRCCVIISKDQELVLAASQGDLGRCESVIPPMEVHKCSSLFHGVINYVINTSTACLLTNAKDDPRFSADDYLKQRTDLRTVLCSPILHKAAMVGVLYMEDFPERAFANKRMLVMNLLVQQLGISITNALLYQSVLQSETKLNGLLENMPCGIALWDATAEHCQYINSSWRDMTGYTLEEIMDSGWSILTHEDEVAIYIQHWRDRVTAGVPCQWESRYRLKDGTYRWAIVRMLPITSPSEEHKIIQWLTVTIDIDDQRRAVQLKSNFLANMSHELRTPFSGILGMLSLLRDSSGLSNEQFEFVDMAKASCEMLIRIVDDLLNFSKLEADKVTLEYIPLCFEEILGDVCDLLVPLASRKGLELIILLDDTVPLILIGDPDRIKQILMNLIGNAIKFSTHGNVVIQFSHELNKKQRKKLPPTPPPSKNVLRPLLPGGAGAAAGQKTLVNTPIAALLAEDVDDPTIGDEVVLHCSVKDQGIGLTPEEQKMLFVSFQQTDNGTTRKYGGTGLGLSIVAQLIAHMHGKIEVESEKGHGATFKFTAKVRTMTDYDQEQSPNETERIQQCEKIVHVREEAVRDKRVLVLSPNLELRKQIRLTLKYVKMFAFDNVASAVESGAICVTDGALAFDKGRSGAMVTEVSTQKDSAMMMMMEVDQHTEVHVTAQNEGESAETKALEPFDFILVDHVLDSSELDSIYPSPRIAFVLLLAPTTETLRWILPPAAKKKKLSDKATTGGDKIVPGECGKAVEEEDDDDDAGEEDNNVDIGGRGRRRNTDGEVKVMGYDEASSTSVTVARTKGIDCGGQSSMAAGSSNATQPASTRPPLSRVPSQLFMKRKSRGHVTVTREIPGGYVPWNGGGSSLDTTGAALSTLEEESSTGTSISGAVALTSSPESMIVETSRQTETVTFQVCRLIKPVRRMKLLQILFNALKEHGQPPPPPSASSSSYAASTASSGYDLCQDEVTWTTGSTSCSHSYSGSSSGSESCFPHSRSVSPARSAGSMAKFLSAPMMMTASKKRRREVTGPQDRTGGSSTVEGSESSSVSTPLSSSTPDVKKPRTRVGMEDDAFSSSSLAAFPHDADIVPDRNMGLCSDGIESCRRSLSKKKSANSSGGSHRYHHAHHHHHHQSRHRHDGGGGGGQGETDAEAGKDDDQRIMPKRAARNNDALTLLLTPEERDRCKGKNVLVAEDDFVSQKILEKQLSKLGMNVMIANNGQEAVDEWLSSEPGHYTIAIFDHHMPIMDGLAATRKVRALEAEFEAKAAAAEAMASGSSKSDNNDNAGTLPGGGHPGRIPIVGLSADIQLSTKESCIKAGMDDHRMEHCLLG